MRALTRVAGALVVVLGSLAGLPSLARAGQAGTAGLMSLRLGAGARAAGMGDAYVSLANDATAAYWNPAGLAAVQRTDFTLMHDEWISTVRMETASVAHATGIGNFGLHFSGMYLDEIERYEDFPSDTPLGHFNVFEIAVTGAYARRIRSWDVGIGLKALHSKLDDVSASGWAVDAGARFHTRIEGLTFAAAAQNMGPQMKFISETFPLPVTLLAGLDYQRDVPSLRGRVTGAVNILWPNDGDARSHVGAEYVYRDFAAVRLGYKANYDSQGLTFGLGLRKAGYHFDYAFADVGNDLGNGHKFSFSVDL